MFLPSTDSSFGTSQRSTASNAWSVNFADRFECSVGSEEHPDDIDGRIDGSRRSGEDESDLSGRYVAVRVIPSTAPPRRSASNSSNDKSGGGGTPGQDLDLGESEPSLTRTSSLKPSSYRPRRSLEGVAKMVVGVNRAKTYHGEEEEGLEPSEGVRELWDEVVNNMDSGESDDC